MKTNALGMTGVGGGIAHGKGRGDGRVARLVMTERTWYPGEGLGRVCEGRIILHEGLVGSHPEISTSPSGRSSKR